MSTDFASILLF